MTPAEFVNAHVGLPYDRARLHCWELVRMAQAEVFGRALPMYARPERLSDQIRAFEEHKERENWQRISAPDHGAIVLLGRIGSRRDLHAGVYLAIDRGGILHTDEPHGVVFEDMMQIEARGWTAAFYAPKA